MQENVWCAPLRPGLVSGLRAERRIAQRLGAAEAGGGLPDGAAAAAERLIAAGATALVSFGLCGGLDAALRPGALVVPRRVIEGQRGYPTDENLSRALGGFTAAALLAGPEPIADAAQKANLFANTGAVAVDLESGAVARVAERAGLPFAALRAVCDPAELSLPEAALAALDPAGGIRLWAVTREILRGPGQIVALIRLARAAAAARAALIRRVGDIGGGRFLVA